MQTLRHVVAGTDFSIDANRAVELAVELALSAAAPLTLVHVCELGDDDDAHRLLECAHALARMVDEHRSRGADVKGVLRSGRPWDKLANVAVEVGATLIVVGRRGAGRRRESEHGSVAGHLVRSAERPVLTVPNDADDT